MKILKYFMSLVAAAGLVTSCSSDLDTVTVLSPENAVAPVLHDLGVSEITFSGENLTEKLLLNWDAADFGVDAVVSYSFRAAYGDREVVVLATSETSAELTYEVLNQSLALAVEDGGLGVPSGESSVISFRVGATIGSNYEMIFSASQQITVTTTTAEKTYETYYVIGSFNGWNHGNVASNFDFLYNFTGDANLYEGIIDFREAGSALEFKFTKGPAWGDGEHSMESGQTDLEPASVTLVSGGGDNINVYGANRYYHFSLDLAGLTLKKNYSFNTIGVVGTINDWGGTPDVEMTYNASKRRFYADVEVAADGEVKFRADNTWGACEYGGADGTLQAGGANIPVAAGQYRMYIYLSDPADLRYEIDASMYGKEEGTTPAPEQPEPEQPTPEKEPNRWGIVGTVNGWGEQPDFYMDEISENLFVRRGLTLTTDDMFKIRFNDEWNDDRNYGLPEGSTERIEANVAVDLFCGGGSANITISVAGTYDFYFDLANSKGYLMDEGLLPDDFEVPSYKFLVDISATGWENVNVYGWGEAGDYGGSWPGTALTETTEIDGKTYWVFEMPVEANGKTVATIFNNGSEQTIDITDIVIDQDHTFVLTQKGDDGKWLVSIDGGEAEAPEDPVVVFADHTWSTAGTHNGWGDTDMTVEDGWAVCKNVEFGDGGKFKVRADKEWAISYGLESDGMFVVADGSEFTLTYNGKDMGVETAGFYDIYFTIVDNVAKMKVVAVGGSTPSDPVEPGEPETEAKAVKIYAYSEDGWSNMNFYAWQTNPIAGDWPGGAMSTESVNGLNFFVYEFPAEANMFGQTINLIFNNGSAQTGDIKDVVLDKEAIYYAVKGSSATVIDPATYTPAPPATSEASKLYLKPGVWASDSPRYEAYFFGNGEKWVTMTQSSVSGCYECELPEGYTNVIFIRMDPNKPEHSWDSKWNQTTDLTIPTDGRNCYEVTDWNNYPESGWKTI